MARLWVFVASLWNRLSSYAQRLRIQSLWSGVPVRYLFVWASRRNRAVGCAVRGQCLFLQLMVPPRAGFFIQFSIGTQRHRISVAIVGPLNSVGKCSQTDTKQHESAPRPLLPAASFAWDPLCHRSGWHASSPCYLGGIPKGVIFEHPVDHPGQLSGHCYLRVVLALEHYPPVSIAHWIVLLGS